MQYRLQVQADIFKLGKIAKSDYSLRQFSPSFLVEQLGFHWTDFHEIWLLRIFRISVEKIHVSLNLF